MSERSKMASDLDNSETSVIEPIECLNCGSRVVGKFCPECGQSASTSRYTFRTIGREIYDQFRKIDIATTFSNFWELTRNPGGFVRSYLSGRRTGWLAPIKYFFYSFVFQIFLAGILYWITSDSAIKSFGDIDFRLEIASLISTLFWGLFWALSYRRSELNVVENIVAAIFFVAQTNFYSILLTLILLPFQLRGPWAGFISEILHVLVYLGYSFYFARTLFAERLLFLVPKQLILSLIYFVVVFFAVFGSVLISESAGQMVK